MYAIKIIPSGIYSRRQAANMPNIILNNLVDTLNMKAKVPHTVVIIINDSDFWNNADMLQYQMDRILFRFIKEIKRIAEARNLSLPPKAVNWDYPRIFITRALPLPNNMVKPYPKGFKANRRRYNRLLLKGEDKQEYLSINLPEFNSENSNGLFASDGTLTHKGYKCFWTTISDAIHRADNNSRILLNKAKAKQLAQQVTVTTKDFDQSQEDSSDISDIDHLETATTRENNTEYSSHTVRRALVSEFNQQEQPRSKLLKMHSQQMQDQVSSSPQSDISQYFTFQHRSRNPDNHHRRQQHTAFNSHTQQPRWEKKNNKSTWRNKHY